ncbi:blue light receptor, partial [Quaeritorhiza haematococci]
QQLLNLSSTSDATIPNLFSSYNDKPAAAPAVAAPAAAAGAVPQIYDPASIPLTPITPITPITPSSASTSGQLAQLPQPHDHQQQQHHQTTTARASFAPPKNLPPSLTPPLSASSSSSSSSSSSASSSSALIPAAAHATSSTTFTRANTLEVSPVNSVSAIPPTVSLSGIYSTTGFDMLGILARVVNRPNPKIMIGPVDFSCSFLVVDARKFDMPIVYASETFTKLTGYCNAEIVGRNCRFLQSPDGVVDRGSYRKYTDNNVVHQMRTSVEQVKECQFTLINYKKGGEPFINLITMIPM